jgi:hypothetical protein
MQMARSQPNEDNAKFHAANAIVRLTATGEGWQPDFVVREIRKAVWYASQGNQASAVRQEEAQQCQLCREIFGNPFRTLPASLNMHSETVLTLARAIYADLTFDGLPIMADALEEVGCVDVELLRHCRGSGPHVLGCWALDLVLGLQ